MLVSLSVTTQYLRSLTYSRRFADTDKEVPSNASRLFSESAEQLVDLARQKTATMRAISQSSCRGSLSRAFSVNERRAEPCPDPLSPCDDDESRDESASSSSALFLPRRISCRMKAPAAIRNATATSSG